MKIAITGHTSGLGKGLYEQLGALGHEVYGYSTSTGFDINDEVHRHKIIGECKDADLFINNAFGFIDPNAPSVRAFAKQTKKERTVPTEFGQVKLFEMFKDAWENDKSKYIINISSDITERNINNSPGIKVYWFAKRLLNEASIDAHNTMCLNLGAFESRMGNELPEWVVKADVKHYVKYVIEIIENMQEFQVYDMLLNLPNEGDYALLHKKDPKKLENFLDFAHKDSVQYANICNIYQEDYSNIDKFIIFIVDNRFDLWPNRVKVRST